MTITEKWLNSQIYSKQIQNFCMKEEAKICPNHITQILIIKLNF